MQRNEVAIGTRNFALCTRGKKKISDKKIFKFVSQMNKQEKKLFIFQALIVCHLHVDAVLKNNQELFERIRKKKKKMIIEYREKERETVHNIIANYL